MRLIVVTFFLGIDFAPKTSISLLVISYNQTVKPTKEMNTNQQRK